MEVTAQVTDQLLLASTSADDPREVRTACRFLALLLAATLFLPSKGLIWRLSANAEVVPLSAQSLACQHCHGVRRR